MLMFIIYTDNCFFSVNFLLNSGFALNDDDNNKNNNNNYLMSFLCRKLETTQLLPHLCLWIDGCLEG